MANKEVVNLAEEHLVDYVTGKFSKALRRVDREQHGKGCGCGSCKVRAVEDVNSWASFIGGEGYEETDYAKGFKYGIDRQGKIFQGKDRRRKEEPREEEE